MAGRGSIGRLMIAMAVIGLAMAVARVWVLGLRWPDEFGPSLVLGLVALAVAILAGPRLRRFCLGLAVSGLLVTLVYENSPWELRHEVHHRLIEPIEAYVFGDRSQLRWGTEAGSPYFTFRHSKGGAKYGVLSGPYRRYEEQFALALCQLPLALIGGGLALAFRRKSRSAARDCKPTADLSGGKSKLIPDVSSDGGCLHGESKHDRSLDARDAGHRFWPGLGPLLAERRELAG